MNNRDAESFILYNNLLANVRELFADSTFDAIEQQLRDYSSLKRLNCFLETLFLLLFFTILGVFIIENLKKN